jgi:hypothetical protein
MYQQVSPPWQGGIATFGDSATAATAAAAARAAATAALLEDLGLPSVESYGAAEGPGHHTMKLCQGTK